MLLTLSGHSVTFSLNFHNKDFDISENIQRNPTLKFGLLIEPYSRHAFINFDPILIILVF